MPRDVRTRIEHFEKGVDDLLSGVSKRKKASIAVSSELPLKLVALRSVYLSGCVLLDVIIMPISLAELVDSAWMYLFLVLLVPIVYLQYLLDKRFFGVRKKDEGEGAQEA